MDIARASIKRRTVVFFLCLLTAIAGVLAYFQIGKLEDPAFPIKTAVVTVVYPGANAYEVEQEATSRVEDAIQSMGEVKHIRSRSTPGLAIIYVDIKDEYSSNELPQMWDILRQKLYDAQSSLPSGCVTAIDNDYGDVYGQYYALVGDSYTMKELWDYADFLKKNLVLVPQVASVKIIGEQEEGIYVEFSASRMARLGISPEAVFNVLNQQNSLSAIGSTIQGNRYIRISPTGAILSVEDIEDLVIGGSSGKLTRLREVATVRRDYIEPQTFKMNFNGRPALGLGIATVTGGNVVDMGEAISQRLRELESFRPVGIELSEVYMQSEKVTASIEEFIINLLESIAIVVGVLLIFMGLRSGLIIGIVLLLTVAGTIAIMNQVGIFLQVVSLAALIIALGSLVDNAIVVAEGMLVGVERGQTVEDAASNTVNGSMWAMLGGTFIAVMAFSPIGLSKDTSGEFARSLFQVVGISMMLSWLAALIVTPALGKSLLKPARQENDPYNRFLFQAYRAFLECCLRHRALTVLLCADSETGMVFDFFLTNKTIYAFYERLPFGRQKMGNYAAFSYQIPVGRRLPSDVHKLGIRYVQGENRADWFVDDTSVFSVTEVGKHISREYMTLNLGGDEEVVTIKQLNAGMGLFTLLDGSWPTGKGLVELSKLTRYYDVTSGESKPAEFVDPASRPENRLFGQGAELVCKGCWVIYE